MVPGLHSSTFMPMGIWCASKRFFTPPHQKSFRRSKLGLWKFTTWYQCGCSTDRSLESTALEAHKIFKMRTPLVSWESLQKNDSMKNFSYCNLEGIHRLTYEGIVIMTSIWVLHWLIARDLIFECNILRGLLWYSPHPQLSQKMDQVFFARKT